MLPAARQLIRLWDDLSVLGGEKRDFGQPISTRRHAILLLSCLSILGDSWHLVGLVSAMIYAPPSLALWRAPPPLTTFYAGRCVVPSTPNQGMPVTASTRELMLV